MESTPEPQSAMIWIPQFFYDLIGRLVPGVAVLAASLLFLPDSAEAKGLVFFLFTKSGAPLSVMVLIGLVFSYLIGTLLGAIGFLFHGKEWRSKLSALDIDKCPDLNDPELLRAFMYDAVQHHDPQAGARLAKLAAEQHMCRVLMVGFVVMGLLKTYLSFRTASTGAFVLTIALALVVVFCSWRLHRHLDIRSTRLLSNQWYQLDLAKKTRVDSKQDNNAPNTGVPPAGSRRR